MLGPGLEMTAVIKPRSGSAREELHKLLGANKFGVAKCSLLGAEHAKFAIGESAYSAVCFLTPEYLLNVSKIERVSDRIGLLNEALCRGCR